MSLALPSQLPRISIESPESSALYHGRRQLLYTVAEKVSMLVVLAIATTALTYAMLGITMASSSFLLMAGAFVVAGLGSIKAANCAAHHRAIADVARGTIEQLKQISSWKSAEIEGFFKKYQLTLNKDSLDALTRSDAKEPLRPLLPLIARFNFWAERTAQAYTNALSSIEAAGGLDDPEIRFFQLNIGYEKLRQGAIPFSFETAAMLQLIARPLEQPTMAPLSRICLQEEGIREFCHLSIRYQRDEALVFTLRDLLEKIEQKDYATLREKLFGSL